MLWNRSLVMQDVETNSLWSQILGEAMDGPLEGTRLETFPSDMVTWAAWKKEHPNTTVLAMSRTHRAYGKDFYRDPTRFVLGWVVDGIPYHVSFDVLRRAPLVEFELEGEPLLLTFDPKTTSALLFSRRIAQRTLSFTLRDDGRIVDRQSGSSWNRSTGEAIDGPMRGQRLEQRAAIVSYTRAWRVFHPESKPIDGDGRVLRKASPRRRRI